MVISKIRKIQASKSRILKKSRYLKRNL